jgi:hypothetical protein
MPSLGRRHYGHIISSASRLAGRVVEAAIVKTVTDKPVGVTHWSSRDLAKATWMS